jgi:hypothetical protein
MQSFSTSYSPIQPSRAMILRLCLLCSLSMAYGWGWRGSYGHEAGAMFPGALLGMSLCLASGRVEWYRRTAAAGLFGAVGWAWGGGLSNMEQTFYVVSDSLPDVLWAFGGVFLVGCLWSGIGSAILSLALTRPRSELNGYIGPLAANGLALFVAYLFFLARPHDRSAIDDWGKTHLHDIKYFAATVMLVASGAYWLVRTGDRRQTGLFVQALVAWGLGYLAFIKLGGIELAPPNRSESWGGFVAVLAVLIVHLARQGNRAAVSMTLMGALTGGLAFVTALFLTHPLVVGWGPFAETTITDTWKLTEESFGFLMGLGVALAAARLLRGGLAPPAEDADRKRLDGFSALVLLIVMMWMNLRGNVREWGQRYDVLPHHAIVGLFAWQWFLAVGVLLTLLGLYVLLRAQRGTLTAILPQSAFGKGAILFLSVLWIGQFAVAIQRFAQWKTGGNILVEVTYWVLAALTTWGVMACAPRESARELQTAETRVSSDPVWQLGSRYWLSWAAVPVLLLTLTAGAMAIQQSPHPKGRMRFGPNAYWRLQLRKTPGEAPGS